MLLRHWTDKKNKQNGAVYCVDFDKLEMWQGKNISSVGSKNDRLNMVVVKRG